MRRGLCAVLLIAAACGGPSDVCAKLGLASSCGNTAQTQCLDAIKKARAEDAKCEPHITALTECLASLTLSCTGSSSIAANGDGKFGAGQNFTDIGGYSVVVNDSTCDVHRRGLEACRTCPTAVGANAVGVLGVADKCGADTAACAAGLTCEGGVCTKSCTVDADCDARADGCRLQYQYANVCASGRCTRSCGDVYACQAWVGKASKCEAKACTL